MNPRNTWLLMLVAAGLFAFIFFVERHLHPPVRAVDRVLGDVAAGSITAIKISPRDVAPIRLERTNGQWRMTEPVGDVVQNYAVNRFVEALAQLMPDSRLTASQLESHKDVESEFGFSVPNYTILIEQGDRQSQLKLGKLTDPGDQIFAQVVGNDGVQVISRSFLKVLPGSADDWRDRTFARFDDTNIDRLTVTNFGSTAPIQFALDSNGLWRITAPIHSPADDPVVTKRLNEARNARITHFITGNSPVDLAAFGLQPPQMELDLWDGTNMVATLQFGRTNADGDLYARAGPQAPVVTVARGQLDDWRNGLDAFRDRFLVYLGDWNVLQRGFSVQAWEESGRPLFSIRCATNGTIWADDTNGLSYAVDQPALKEFFTRLAQLRTANPYTNSSIFAVKDIVQPSDLGDYGLAETNYVRRYQLNLTPPGAAPTVLAKIDIGLPNPNNNGTLFVRREHVPDDSVYAVKEEDVKTLYSRALDFRSRSVWDLDGSNVNSMTVSLNGQAVSLEHRGLTEWAVTSGQGISDPNKEVLNEDAVDRLLCEMRCSAWIGRVAKDPPELGFSELSLHVQMQFKDGRTRSVDFGDAYKYGGRFAATTLDDGQRWLFLFPEKDWNELMKELWMPMGDAGTSKERAAAGP